jgi:hypothetical protein
MRCGGTEGAVQLVRFDGVYGPESYDMRMASTVQGSSPMKMEMKISAKRVGECDSRTAAK